MAKTVFFVDDDEDDRFLFRQAISIVNKELNVFEMIDGQHLMEAIEDFSANQIDLVLLDLNMPRMNGLETVKAIRAKFPINPIPTVIISTASHPLYIEQAYACGATDFITKPNSFEGIIELARQLTYRFLM